MAKSQTRSEDGASEKKAALFNWIDSSEAPEGTLEYSQVLALKDGVRAAIENDESILGAPGALSSERWSHAGVGVSIYMHESGIVVLKTGDERLVTTAETLDNIDKARARFFAEPGMVAVATDLEESDGEEEI